jgi:hypothetical protein
MMPLDDLFALQQVVVGTYLRGLMALATFPLELAQEMQRNHAEVSSPEFDSTSRAGNVVPITSRSVRPARDRETRSLAGTVLSYAAFARRLKRKMIKMTSTGRLP